MMESRTYQRSGLHVTITDATDQNNMLLRLAYVIVTGTEFIMAPTIAMVRIDRSTGHGNLKVTRLASNVRHVHPEYSLVGWMVPDQELAQLLYDVGIFDFDDDELPPDLAQQLRDL